MEAGFTLVEVLVAFVVASLLLTVITTGLLAARERRRIIERKQDAVLLARTLIMEATLRPYDPHNEQGQDGALSWIVLEQPVAVDPRGQFVLSGLEVRISDAQGRNLFTGVTRKLKALPAL